MKQLHLDGLAAKVVGYFGDNPDDTLSRGDIATKFDFLPASIDGALKNAVSSGLLEVVVDDVDGRIWRIGPKHDRKPAAPNSAFKTWLAGRAQPSAEGRAKPMPLPDPATLKIEKGIEIPPTRTGMELKYSAFLESLEPGDSFTVDLVVGKRMRMLLTAFQKRSGTRFLTRQLKDDDGKDVCRLWRVDGMSEQPPTAIVPPGAAAAARAAKDNAATKRTSRRSGAAE